MTRSASSTARRSNRRTPTVAVPVEGTALLLIDVINELAFPGSEMLVAKRSQWRGGSRRSNAAPLRLVCL
jgi:hypothetical protein